MGRLSLKQWFLFFYRRQFSSVEAENVVLTGFESMTSREVDFTMYVVSPDDESRVLSQQALFEAVTVSIFCS